MAPSGGVADRELLARVPEGVRVAIPLDDLRAGELKSLVGEFSTFAVRALRGDADAMAGLEALAGLDLPFSSAARRVIAEGDWIRSLFSIGDPMIFGKRVEEYLATVLRRIRDDVEAGRDDPVRRQQFVHGAVYGSLAVAEQMFRELFLTEGESLEAHFVHHDVLMSGRQEVLLYAEARAERIPHYLSGSPLLGDPPADLRGHILRAVGFAKTMAELERISFDVVIPAGLRYRDGFDATLLDFAMNELVWNAVKYHASRGTPGRFVRISWDGERRAFVFEDNGTGIARPDRIWDRGYREAGRYPGIPPGTGMGLANIRELMDAIGWRIDVESQVDVGTRFIITPRAGDVVEGTPLQTLALGSSFGGVVEEGGSESGGGGESAASAEPLEDADSAAIMGVETMIGANAGPAAIVTMPPASILVK